MRTTKKAFSGSISDLEKYLTWECKERNKETKHAVLYFCKKCEQKVEPIDNIDGYCEKCVTK